MERAHCGPNCDDLKLGAKNTACRELREESGLVLDTLQMEDLMDLPEKEGEDWKPLGVMDEWCWIDILSFNFESVHTIIVCGRFSLQQLL